MICSIENCSGKVIARGWCNKHYQRWQKHGDPLKGDRRARPQCSIDGCERPHYAHGYCNAHYLRFREHGDPLAGKTARYEARTFYENIVLTVCV